MELKEIEKQIQLLTGCSSLESGTIMIFIENYGKEQYNQALIDAAVSAKVKTKAITNDFGTVKIDVWPFVDKQSILTLKKH